MQIDLLQILLSVDYNFRIRIKHYSNTKAKTMRFYFYDRNGKELYHPLNGCGVGWTGAYVTTKGNDFCECPQEDVWRDARGRAARRMISKLRGEYITAADFDTNAVLVKCWAPEKSMTEWFWLIDEESCQKIKEANN